MYLERRLTAADIYQGGEASDPDDPMRMCSVGWMCYVARKDDHGRPVKYEEYMPVMTGMESLFVSKVGLSGICSIPPWSDKTDPEVVAETLNAVFEELELIRPLQAEIDTVLEEAEVHVAPGSKIAVCA